MFTLLNNALDASQSSWAEQTLKKMSLQEKIGQLFIVTAVTNPEDTRNEWWYTQKNLGVDKTYVKHLIQKYNIGGVIFLGTGELKEQVSYTNKFQDASKVPLFIAQDYEAGTGSRNQNGSLRFPCAMSLGAVQNPTLIYDVAYETGKHCQALGVNINFAPVVDVNNNPNNPVIGFRSFGSQPNTVIEKAIAYTEGLQNAGIIACAKHFPGHGDTDLDSHHELPTINHSRERLNEIELAPFKAMITEQVKSIMTAHLRIPALDENITSSLSPKMITDLLRNEMAFNGLIITDALMMRAVSDHYKPGELELKALQAGNDILLCPTDVSRAVACIEHAIDHGTISEQELDAHVLRILKAKEWIFSQRNWQTHALENYDQIINSDTALTLKQKVFEQSITAYNFNQEEFTLDDATVIQIGSAPKDAFIQSLPIESKNLFKLSKKPSTDEIETIIEKIDAAKPAIVALFGMTRDPHKQFGVSENSLKLINALQEKTTTIIALFGSPYFLNNLDKATRALIAYEADPIAQQEVAAILKRTKKAQGILPVQLH